MHSFRVERESLRLQLITSQSSPPNAPVQGRAAERTVHFNRWLGGALALGESATDGQTVRLSPAFVQPVVSDDVAAALVDVTLGAPVNGTVELAGPERLRLDKLVQRFLSANQDARQVVADVHARYFGAELNDQSLTPGDNPRITPTRFEDWLSRGR